MNSFNQIEIQKLSSSTQDMRYLLCCHGHYYEANYPIVELVEVLKKYEHQEEAISAYIRQKEGKYTPEQVARLIAGYVIPLLTPRQRKIKTFLYQKDVFTAAAVDKFSDAFRFLFHPACLGIFLMLNILLNFYFFFSTAHVLQFNNLIDIYTLAGLVLFMLFSSLFHELGHASACKYFGVKHGGIGFGLYLNFPVLYTEVTEVWRLDRRQRCIVNIAGVYFQSFCLSALLITFFFTGNDMLRYMILIMNLGFVITLNPFFKFDGYWIVSDLLGVPNLRKRSKEFFLYFYRWLRKKPVGEKPYLLQINRIEKYGLLIYSVLVNVFMGYYFFYVIPRFMANFISSFPDEMDQLILYLSNNMTPPFALLRNIGMQVIFLGLLTLFGVNILRSLKKYVRFK